jgi:hypothetical protein
MVKVTGRVNKPSTPCLDLADAQGLRQSLADHHRQPHSRGPGPSHPPVLQSAQIDARVLAQSVMRMFHAITTFRALPAVIRPSGACPTSAPQRLSCTHLRVQCVRSSACRDSVIRAPMTLQARCRPDTRWLQALIDGPLASSKRPHPHSKRPGSGPQPARFRARIAALSSS